MIVHDHIVASEDHQQHDTDHIDKECRNRGYHVGKTGTCHKDCVDTCDRGKSVCGTDSKSACLRTSTARSTVTPTTLLSFPMNLLYKDTTATQNIITRYTLKL